MELDQIIAKIEASRKELLDLGLRNPLLNYRLLKSRGVEIVDELPSAIFDILVSNERAMSFLPRPDDDKDYELGQPEYDDEDTLARRHIDNHLQTNETSDRLQSRLLNTYYAANTVIQEQGVNTLFVALGMVEWYASDTSAIVRRAPLVLVPIELDRSDARGRFHVTYTGEELGANLSFIEKVRHDFGIEVPELPDEEDLDIDAYFTEVSRRIDDMNEWRVDRSSIVLGFFSFNKFLMYRDLDYGNWPEGQGYGPKESDIIRPLFGDGFSEPDTKIGEEDHLDDQLSPEDVHHVVDADSSQTLAIFDVNLGRNLVIQGPPGTGKSQTITNIIAEAIGKGSKVLFVSEKMAALEVVKRRLDSIGLGVACLELHSRKTTKRLVLDDLERTLELGQPSVDGIEDDFNRLARVQDRLNAYAKAVNAPVGTTGVTPFRAYGELMVLRDLEENYVPLPRVEMPGMDSWAGADFSLRVEAVSEFQARLERVGTPNKHVFWGSRLLGLLPTNQSSLKEKIDTALQSLETLTGTANGLGDALGLHSPEDAAQTRALIPIAEHASEAPNIQGVNLSTFERRSQRDAMKRLVEAGRSWFKLRSEYDAILDPSTWGADVQKTHDTLSTIGRKFQRCVHPQFYNSPNNPSISQELIDSAMESLKALTEASLSLSDALGMRPPRDAGQTLVLMPIAEHASEAPDIEGVDLWAFEPQSRRDAMRSLVEAGRSWVKLHSEYDDILDPSAWDADVRQTHRTLSTVGRRLWRFVSPKFRRSQAYLSELCLSALPESTDRQVEIVEAILQEQGYRRTLERLSSTAGTVLGPKWRGPESDWELVGRIVEWALTLLDKVDKGEIDLGTIKSLRDDIDAAHVRDLLEQIGTSSNSHAERVGALLSVIDIDLDDGGELLSLPYSEQMDILAGLSGENVELGRASAHLSALYRDGPSVGVERQIETLDAVIQEQERRQTVELLSSTASTALGQRWQGVESDWEVVGRIVDWALSLHDDVDKGRIALNVARSLREDIEADSVSVLLNQAKTALNSHDRFAEKLGDSLQMDNERRFNSTEGLKARPFAEQREILETWSGSMDDLQDIVLLNGAAKEAEENGLGPILELADQWPDAVAHLKRVLQRAWYEHVLSCALKERPHLNSFDGNVHDQQVGQFRAMDELALDHNCVRVVQSHWEQLPKHSAGGQLWTLRREFEKKRRHLPIRELMLHAGNAIQAIKPVFMMSPLSIATYLAPGSVRFDLVVFDEASQVRPVDALGALMRADQAVVVGDSQQLPPTRFFDTVTQSEDDDDESMTADIESILGLFRAQGAPDRMLRWHYRSRHESLIAVSNREFYENGLVVFPSPDGGRENLGLRYHYIPEAVYDRARSRTNRKEAAEVARAVMRHARQNPSQTLGVAAFSSAQREAIQDELERLRRFDPSNEEFFNAHPEEPFFVKNLENVQGDERDVIFISVGYGKDSYGQVAMNFGPLSTDGGERRLNVLITRAKLRCHVFTNLRATDIDINRTSSRGARALKTFLSYAETGVLKDIEVESGRELYSPFQEAVADKLRSLGHDVREEVTAGGKFVDLAVVDPERPGRYILGIECDGASYHGSRTARERDRLREQHLKELGWRLHRIWSTDWFRNPDRELKRAAEAIEQARIAQPPDRAVERSARSNIERLDDDSEASDLASPEYATAQPKVDIDPYRLDTVPQYYMLNPITEIVRIEGPVHISEVQRRIADAVGVARVGQRIKRNLGWAIDNAVRREAVVRKEDFLWSTDMHVPAVRDRTDLPRKKIEMVAPQEIAEAIKIIVEHSYGIGRAEAATATARLLGFRNVSKNIRTHIDRIVEMLIESGDVVTNGDQILASR